MHRVPCEKRGDHGAAPKRPGHSLQDEKQEHGVRRVQQDVDGMIPGQIEGVALIIQHVGEPHQGHPIAPVARLHAPGQSAPARAAAQMEIIDDEGGVIAVDETES